MSTETTFEIVEGTDAQVSFRVTRDDAALDLTGKEVEFYGRASRSDPSAGGAFEYTTDNSRVVVDEGTGGTGVILFRAADAVAGTYYFRLDVIDGLNRETPIYGVFGVKDV